MFWNKFVYVILYPAQGVTLPAQGLQLMSLSKGQHTFSVIPANDTKESMFGQQNVSSSAAGIKPDILAPEASMCANH